MSNTYEEIIEILNYREQEKIHFMPNEIFEDLQTNLSKSPHITFAYSYYYLISWLYRNAKYGTQSIDVATIKQLLGYSPTTKTINHIIKNGGVLDLLGYTETTSNYPIAWGMDEYNDPEFFLIDDADYFMKKEIRMENGNRFTAKYPIKHLHINQEDYEDEMKTGVFYDVSNTHMIDFETFIHCMSIEKLGVTGFYLYGFLKNKNQIYGEGYDVPLPKLCEETQLSYQSLVSYLDALRKYNLIDVVHNQDYYAPGLEDEYRKANTYITNDPIRFTFIEQGYKKMNVKTYDEHIKIISKKKKKVAFGELPFN
ncbi:hypothetical protein J2Z83_000091 [Virgibacillus natechei]|uniref:Uncharacterized protein n=1 Tax=Virgibacillus natechei TaxID=1216297 RepID=A0ABS4IAP7_9BACI|nr:hypothetical protein [Virgibacillus natechei]MBP1967999.1 hypothetical protein [Virgibacillus natechei]UZD14718.1 hypothetical protein OLD84_09545 [Virgibacillus natechei]